jgi:hypothetical protein
MNINTWDEGRTFANSLIGARLKSAERLEHGYYAFMFSNGAALVVPSLWRIISDGQIVLCRDDYGHQYGLPAKIDCIAEVIKRLGEKAITAITIQPDTSDLILRFGNDLRLEIISDSSGYEGWRFSGVDGLQAVALPSGGPSYWYDKPK